MEDDSDGPISHFPIVERLQAMGLHSAYHSVRDVKQGIGEDTTFWSARGDSYMIDHLFTPTTWPISTVTVDKDDPWHDRSDHAPVIVELEAPAPTEA